MRIQVACVVVVGLGVLFFLCGYSTIHWRTSTSMVSLHQGLWRVCSDDYGCAAITRPKPWLRAVQVFETIGLGFIILSFVLTCLSFTQKSAKYIIVQVITNFSTACFIFLGLVIYAFKCEWEDYVTFQEGHSFYLTFVSGASFIVTSLLNIARYKNEQKHNTMW